MMEQGRDGIRRSQAEAIWSSVKYISSINPELAHLRTTWLPQHHPQSCTCRVFTLAKRSMWNASSSYVEQLVCSIHQGVCFACHPRLRLWQDEVFYPAVFVSTVVISAKPLRTWGYQWKYAQPWVTPEGTCMAVILSAKYHERRCHIYSSFPDATNN